MKVKPKLYLNMSPQTIEDGALAFARNMKIDDDGNLVSDFGYQDITINIEEEGEEAPLNSYNIVGHIVGIDNTIYFFAHHEPLNEQEEQQEEQQEQEQEEQEESDVEKSYIIEYNELTNEGHIIDTHWHYSGGKITGYVNTNITGEKILTIGEYDAGVDVPLKHINLSHANDEETFYSQAPICPTANLILKDTYVKTIPNGVYVFFIRYKIRKDVYTNWFICSRPIFSGGSERTATLQGGLKYINLHKDAAKSFVLQLDFLQDNNDNKGNYKEFQLGFIITHDEATDARMWKHFDMSKFVTGTPNYHTPDPEHPGQYLPDQNLVYFDYEDVEEANIDDLLKTTYELYNVKNITSFKNKLYVSNYIESDLNITFDNINTLISINYNSEDISDTSHKNVIFNPSGTSYTAIYNYAKRYYDSGIYNGNTDTINNIINSSIDLDDVFDLEIVSNLIKESSKVYKDALTFKVSWSADAYSTADIAFVNNIVNNILGKAIYGQNFNTGYPTSGSDSDHNVFSAYGVYQLATYGDLGYYEEKQYYEHPWYNIDLTFAFGALSADYNPKGAINNLYPFNKDNKYTIGNYSCWVAKDIEFTEYAKNSIPKILKKEIEAKGLFVLDYIEVLSGTKIKYYNHYTANNDKDKENYVGFNNTGIFIAMYDCTGEFSDETININLSNHIKAAVRSLCTTIQGFDDNGTPIFKVDGDEEIKSNTVKVVLKKFDFELNNNEVKNIDDEYDCEFSADLTSTTYYAVLNVRFKDNVLNVSVNDSNVEQYPTLMPYSKYAAYVHFVDNHNIITNGIRLNDIALSGNDNIAKGLKRIYLTYKTDSTLPSVASNYKSFFISLVNIGDIVIEGFGWTRVGTTNILNSIEVDSLLYNINDNITIKINSNGIVTTITGAKYYSSGDANKALAFGNCGFISWEGNFSDDYSSSKFYIIISRNKTSENTDRLIKASSFIPITAENSYKELPDGYYGSYVCNVTKADFELSSNSYVSGNDVYSAERNATIVLTEFKNFISIFGSVNYIIRSNFNLNYLSLTEDITDKVFSVGSAASGTKQVAKIINSAILSNIYELKSMYKDFMNKIFRPYDEDNKIEFDNTIRVSNVLSDETFNNSVFKFDSENYYNIPTDRGIIVNLFSISNTIFAHCKHSLFKFDGNQTIMTSENDIRLQETEPFDTGVSQVFDSQYGYGGIDNKESGCITFDSYVFYDRFSNHIFAYGGNSQIQQIDGSIYKLISYYKPDKCYTLHDDANHRILFDFRVGDFKFCLSYNYKAKSFISLHDIILTNAFCSRMKCYFYRSRTNQKDTGSTLCTLFDSTTIPTTVLDSATNTLALYGIASGICDIQFGTNQYRPQDTPFGLAIVCFPSEGLREVINTIKYIANTVKATIETKTTTGQQPTFLYDLINNPEQTLFNTGKAVNPVHSMYIITDSCLSNKVMSVVNGTPTVDETARPNTLLDSPPIPNSLLDYKGFRYDIDSWNSNYFRNILHADNIYQYPDQPRATETPNSDNNSLVYGKYFIINFNFITSNPIKFEHIFITTNAY